MFSGTPEQFSGKVLSVKNVVLLAVIVGHSENKTLNLLGVSP